MLDSPQLQRRIGKLAWLSAWVGLVAGQLHALSRFATKDGQQDLEMPLTAAWAEPASNWLRPLLDWGDPDLVYLTYGKIWFPVFAAFTLCAFVVYRRRRSTGFETWAWRAALTGYVLGCVATFLDYWTQWTSDYNVLFDVGWYVTVPSFLIDMVATTVLGVTLLVRRFRPLLPALLLAGYVPLAAGILQATSMGSAALPVMFAFGILGRRIAREVPAPSADSARSGDEAKPSPARARPGGL